MNVIILLILYNIYFKCVLGVLGEIVIKVLTAEDLDENNKDLRKNFLDVLEVRLILT